MQTMGLTGFGGSNGGVQLAGERRLMDRLVSLRQRKGGWYAVRIALSRVRSIDLQPAVLALVLIPLRSLASRYDVEVFEFRDRTIVALCRNTPVDAMQATLVEMRSLLRADAAVDEPIETSDSAFVTWYDLGDAAHADLLLEWTKERLARTPSPPAAAAAAPSPRLPTTADLDEIQRRLQEIQFSDLIRQQVALEVQPGARARTVFRETYVSIAELCHRLGIDVHPHANPWLFRYLTELLDRRMILAVHQERLACADVPISLNVNLSTLETGDPARFKDTFGRAPPGTMFEIQFIDAIADTETFLDASRRLRAQGFCVAIDGMDPLALPFVDLAGLDPDLLKLWWTDRVDGRTETADPRAVNEAIGRFGLDRVLLARVDSEDGIKWGKRLGIRRFQGRFIDNLLHGGEPTKGVCDGPRNGT